MEMMPLTTYNLNPMPSPKDALRNIAQKLNVLSIYRAIRNKLSMVFRVELRHRNRLQLFYTSFIHPNDVVFDIGANVGNRTRIFLACNARVVAVEPQSECAMLLEEMFSANPNFKLEQVAIGEKEGEAELSISDGRNIFSTLSEKWKSATRFEKSVEWNRTEMVRVTTLDTLIKKYGVPAFCKIDIEGYERYALIGLTSAIPVISFEFNSIFIEELEACLKLLQRLGEFECNIGFAENMELYFGNTWVTSETLILEIANHKDSWGDVYVRFTNSNGESSH